MSTEPDSFTDLVKRGDNAAVLDRLEGDPELASRPSPDGLTPVLAALYWGQRATADLLVDRGARLDLFEACAAGQPEVVRAELDRNPSRLEEFSPDGFTPLQLAAFFGRANLARELLARGADPASVSTGGIRTTPLHAAIAARDAVVAREIAEAGGLATFALERGYTPLHGAADLGDAALGRALLDRGADPNARQDDGRTPLAVAEEKGHAGFAALLRERGATA